MKLLLQDGEAIELLAEASTLLGQARVPADVCKALAMARLTALRKPDGGVRGIATNDMFRRLVSKALAREWADKFDQATRPFQFALQARAGTDVLATHVRAALATRSGAVLVSLDGRSAYDSMSRAAFLGKLREVAPELLPFVRLFYGSPSSYCWWDSAGRCRDVPQGEGCEQGDASLPHFSRSDSTMRSNRRKRRYTPTTASSLFWTTSTLSHSRPAREPPWTRPCALSKPGVASHPTLARHG